MKICNRCRESKPDNDFSERKIANDCFRLWCSRCCADYDKWQHKKFLASLRSRYYSMIRRCTDGSDPHYGDYGGRGIQCLFISPDDYIDHIVNDLGYDTYEKIRKLDVDRTDNNGHYERGNIRLVTHSENIKNRRK